MRVLSFRLNYKSLTLNTYKRDTKLFYCKLIMHFMHQAQKGFVADKIYKSTKSSEDLNVVNNFIKEYNEKFDENLPLLTMEEAKNG